MDKCPSCDKIVLSDYIFCPRCGTALREGAQTAADNVPGEDAVKFFKLARQLSTADNIDLLLTKIGRASESILNADRSAILLLDEKKENLYFKTASGEEILKKITIPVTKGIAGWIAKNRKPEIVNNPYGDERFSPETDKKTGYKTESIAAAPMIAGNELVGVIEVLNKKGGNFTKSDLENLSGFAGLAAVSILNTKLRAQQDNVLSNILDYLVIGSEALSSPEETSRGHTWEMARMAAAMTGELKLSEKIRQTVHRAAMLHDIGFLGMEDPQLLGFNINSELTDEAKFRLHPVISSEMIKRIKPLAAAAPYIIGHHRYRNGEGFPENLPPESITPEMEIISILEDYLTVKDKNKLNCQRYTRQIWDVFFKTLSD